MNTQDEPTMKFTPHFTDYKERDKFIIENADYFVLTKVRNRPHRYEFPTLAEARAAAPCLMNEHGGTWMLYAVYGQQDTFVEYFL